jgi:hypothetical protein
MRRLRARAACGIAKDPPRLARRGKRHAEAQQQEQEAPFGHEPEAHDQSEKECAGRRRPLGKGKCGDKQRKHRREQRERVGDALMDLPAEPEEQHEREGKGGGKARASDRAQQRHSEQNAGGCDQGVAQDEVRQRAGPNGLLHGPQHHS